MGEKILRERESREKGEGKRGSCEKEIRERGRVDLERKRYRRGGERIWIERDIGEGERGS